MVAEISAFNEELELRQSLQEWEPAPHLLAQINSEWSSFLTSLWRCCCTVASWISYPRDTTPCCACFSLPLFGKCTDLTLVLIFKQPGCSEVFQNLGSFERSITTEMQLPGRGRGVWEFWMALLSGFVKRRSAGPSDFSISSGSRFNFLVVRE